MYNSQTLDARHQIRGKPDYALRHAVNPQFLPDEAVG